jgi:hypothetical protein
MLSRIVAILVFMPFFIQAQINSECGFKMSPNDFANYIARVQSVSSLLPHDTCLNRELSLVFHIVKDSMGQPGVTIADIDACVAKLNIAWKPICITFRRCSLNYVSDFNYNQWKNVLHEPTFSSNYYVDNTIDIVLVDNIVLPAGAAGYADPMGHIVMNKSAIGGTVPIHEMGHLFGLQHTFAEISTQSDMGPSSELAVRSNCTINGDGFCDTEADPYPNGKVPGAPCGFQPGPKDANNNYYTPPLDNYMTYFKACNCRFTQEQYNFMALTFILFGTQLH